MNELEQLDLPTHDVDELRARRVRTAALAELARVRRANTGWRGVWRRAELVLVGGAAAGYLIWALQSAAFPWLR
jgi:hypothetical protein